MCSGPLKVCSLILQLQQLVRVQRISLGAGGLRLLPLLLAKTPSVTWPIANAFPKHFTELLGHAGNSEQYKDLNRSYAGCEIRNSLAIDFDSKAIFWGFCSVLLCCEGVSLHVSLLLCKLNRECTHPLSSGPPKPLISLPVGEVKGTCNRSSGRLKEGWPPTHHFCQRAKPSRETPSVSTGSAHSPDPRSQRTRAYFCFVSL